MTHKDKPDTTSASNDIDEIRHKIGVNMGLYYRESDNKWLREKHDNGRYIGVEDMTPELDSVLKIIAQEATKARLDEASHYCDEGHFHDNDRDLAMLPSERVAELTAHKESKE